MREIKLIISHADIMAETSKWGYTVGENIQDEMAKHRHFVQGVTDAGHDELMKAAADNAWADVLQVLSAYTVDGQCACGCDYKCGCGDGLGTSDVNEETGMYDPECCYDYSVMLFFPDNTYPSIGGNVSRLVRRYITCKMRSEWEYLTRQDSSRSEADAETAIRRLKVEINTRTTKQRVKGSWRYGY